jgi:hypothetical protein
MTENQTQQPQSIVGEIVEGLHNLEQKVDHLIHPTDAVPSSTEPAWEPNATQLAAIAMGTNTQTTQEAGSAVLGEPTATGATDAGAASADSSSVAAVATPSDALAVGTPTPPASSDANAASPASPTDDVAAHAPLIPSLTAMAAEIRTRLRNIKSVLHGTEDSVAAVIQAELAAIERAL